MAGKDSRESICIFYFQKLKKRKFLKLKENRFMQQEKYT